MGRRYSPEVERDDGWTDWLRPLPGYRFSCCDCDLVHELEFRVDDNGNPNFRSRRDNRATGQKRRYRKRDAA